ncbi:hypothetical protein MP228_012651 [Amoeboaphelidium protococcarum]|nr:hypothetical protein MP228_012651 [Amoeboaphelidium protococcarum]
MSDINDVNAMLSQISMQIRRQDTHASPTSQIAFNKQNHLGDVHEIILTDANSVDMSVKIMDLRYKTSFYGWIKSEDNVDYIGNYLKPLVYEYAEQEDGAKSISRALTWLMDGWNINGVASLLIKLFYEKGLNQEIFTSVMSLYLLGKEWSAIIDIVATLLIGEQAGVVSLFIHNLTREWYVEEVKELIMCIAVKSRWTEEFVSQFLLSLCELRCGDDKMKMAAIMEKAQDRRVALKLHEAGSTTTTTAAISDSKLSIDTKNNFLGSVLTDILGQSPDALTPKASQKPNLDGSATLNPSHVSTESSPLSLSPTSPKKFSV